MNKFVHTYITSLHKSAGILGDLSQSASQVGQAAMNSPIGQNVQSGINAVKNSPIGQTVAQVGSAAQNSPIGRDISSAYHTAVNGIGKMNSAFQFLVPPPKALTPGLSENDMAVGKRLLSTVKTFNGTRPIGESVEGIQNSIQPNPYGILGSKSSINPARPNFATQGYMHLNAHPEPVTN